MESIRDEIKQEEKSVIELCDKMGIRSDSVNSLFAVGNLKIWENEYGVDRRQGRSLNDIRDIVAKTRDSLAEVRKRFRFNDVDICSTNHRDSGILEGSI